MISEARAKVAAQLVVLYPLAWSVALEQRPGSGELAGPRA
jgi:hypothetical protein